MVAYLAVQTGQDKGKQYPLDPDRPMHVGRAIGCEIVLTDPNSSRFHAVVYFEDDHWHVRDTDSRNGTFVNGKKIDHARLLDQSEIVIGKTSMVVIAPDDDSILGDSFSQTLYEDIESWTSRQNDVVREPGQLVDDAGQLLDLYQLSLALLGGQRADEIIDTTLELLLDRTSSELVALVIEPTDGRFKIRRRFPTDAPPPTLDRPRLRRVLHQQEMYVSGLHDSSVRIVGEDALRATAELPTAMREPGSADDAAAAVDKAVGADGTLIVPIVHESKSIGALLLQRSGKPYEASLCDLTRGAAGLLSVGIVQSSRNENLRVEHQRIADRNADQDELIGNSKAMLRLKERISRVGRASGSVLIRGESGSGKELVARAVHRASPRNDHPMLTVNCAAIPRDLLESQLFGHKKGSFTGADQDHDGLFQQADQGTLFLDEIGEMSLDGQAKLLRILEGHPFLPVGATKQVSVDVRVIAATNRDLAEFVRDGRFREDLFYRLSVFELNVPPLRDRGDDLENLIDHFLDHFLRQHGRPNLTLHAQARQRMRTYAWPGNVRQLRNVIDSAVVMADEPCITPEDLGLRDTGGETLETLRIDAWEKRLITRALDRTSGSVPEAAKLLGISRATAYRKIGEYDIQR
ncbi:MAG: sigma 54-interacting transcriptional regulator [Planctomycetota bacterium]